MASTEIISKLDEILAKTKSIEKNIEWIEFEFSAKTESIEKNIERIEFEFRSTQSQMTAIRSVVENSDARLIRLDEKLDFTNVEVMMFLGCSYEISDRIETLGNNITALDTKVDDLANKVVQLENKTTVLDMRTTDLHQQMMNAGGNVQPAMVNGR